jgi:hypothetical protein
MSNPNNQNNAAKEADARAEAERVAAEKAAAEQAEAERVAAEKAAAEQAEAVKKAEKDPPAWKLPGYAGPLDINQAQWRMANLKAGSGKK